MSNANIAQKSPFTVAVEEGKEYWWCSCGNSKNQPFCDGSHQDTEFEPVQYTAEETGTVFFCGCKHTGSKPLCDGTHSEL